MCRGIANDPWLLELADLVPPPQLRVNVLLAAVHHLLLEGADHELATSYPSVCRRRDIEYEAVPDDALQARFASFCRSHRDPIAQRCASRGTQTNEVARCMAIRSVLCALRARGDASVGMLDLGCSAGLNLFADAYAYDYGGHRAGPVAGTPLLRCELRGDVPPLDAPVVSHRVGLDLEPVAAGDADAVAWLLACLWPDDLARFDRLDAALGVVAARAGELTLVRGDMVEDLDAAAALADGAERLVVVDSWSAAYLPPARRRLLAESMRALAARRPLTWVSLEFPSVVADFGFLVDAAASHGSDASVVCVSEFDGASARSVVVARSHHHGQWLDWSAASAASIAGT